MLERDEDLWIPASALQHFAFCQTQCALIHNDLVWEENLLTEQGVTLHQKSDTRGHERRNNKEEVRGVTYYHSELFLSAKPDRVIWENGVPRPYEMKRGRTKPEPWDEVQLCAGGLCVGYETGANVSHGILYYAAEKKSHVVAFSETLIKYTLDILKKTRSLLTSGTTPQGTLMKGCKNCSLKFQCMPARNGRA